VIIAISTYQIIRDFIGQFYHKLSAKTDIDWHLSPAGHPWDLTKNNGDPITGKPTSWRGKSR
jgi:hypothetical protein